MSNKLVIIDGNSIFYRSFYALPLLSNSRGEYSNAVYGFAIQIQHIIDKIKPKYMVVAFDASKKTFRNELYSEYKANRKPMPDELRSQIVPLKNLLKLMNIAVVEKEGLEGDDIIGIVSKKFLDTETIIVTGDRDSFQLVDKCTSVYFTKKGTSELAVMDEKALKEEYGVTPEQFIDVKALQGDTSDNIPGVAGVGPKTAIDLITKYGNLDGVYSHIDELSGKLKDRLVEDKDKAYLSQKLATIVTKPELIDLSLKECEYDYPFSKEVFDFYKNYEFKTLLKNEASFNLNIGKKPDETNIAVNYVKKEKLQTVIQNATKNGKLAIYFAQNDVHLSYGEEELVMRISNDLLGEGVSDYEFFEMMKPLLEDEKIEKICLDAKQDMYLLLKYKCELAGYFDCSVAKYLIDGIPVDSLKDVLFDDDIKFVATNLYKKADEFKVAIEDQGIHFLFYEVENPLVAVLFSMEKEGFKIDSDILNSLKQKYELEIKTLESKVYELAGEQFNLNSPKQLGEILYDKLGLKHNKKKSTDAESLEELRSQNDIIEYILRYRKVSKFLSTYILGIYPHIDAEGKVHTYFKQTFTTTGRLSSTEPNLQNIPIRSEESREIRSMFVASSPENVLIDADYSQIELRLLAHFTEDPVFIDAFNTGLDIHTKTASEVFGVDESLVTPEMRRTAKVVNFGIIYGISEYGLADDLKIPPKQARAFIQNFYAMHPAVQRYMEKTVEEARKNSKVSTLFGRTRRLFDINSSTYLVRTRAERASQNMPLQGTAADIIKIAMVKTYNALKQNNLKAKLIMQVHDELIIDAPKEESEQVCKLLKDEMENACKLSVPLIAQCATSYRWSDGH